MTTYRPRRDDRFEYVVEAIAHIEEKNCGLGCKNAIEGEYPGNECPIINDILLETPNPAVVDHDDWLECTERAPS